MNTGIEVYFTKVNMPWSNSQGNHTHYVNVYSPDGVEKIGVHAPDGYVAIDLPPGRYLVTGTTYGVYVNFDSNESIVNVGCGQRACVTIIPKSLHSCVWWTYTALNLVAQNTKLAPELANVAKEAAAKLAEVERLIPKEHRQLPFVEEAIKVIGEKRPSEKRERKS